jgi:Flp pilus assembly protein TadG
MRTIDDEGGGRGRRGQGLVELAIGLPVLMLILMGTIDLGRMYADYVDLKGAVRDGAGYGQLKPYDTSGIQTRVLNAGAPAGTTVTSACQGDCTTIGGSGKIVVTGTCTFQPITFSFLSQFGLGSVTLRAEARMRVLT